MPIPPLQTIKITYTTRGHKERRKCCGLSSRNDMALNYEVAGMALMVKDPEKLKAAMRAFIARDGEAQEMYILNPDLWPVKSEEKKVD